MTEQTDHPKIDSRPAQENREVTEAKQKYGNALQAEQDAFKSLMEEKAAIEVAWQRGTFEDQQVRRAMGQVIEKTEIARHELIAAPKKEAPEQHSELVAQLKAKDAFIQAITKDEGPAEGDPLAKREELARRMERRKEAKRAYLRMFYSEQDEMDKADISELENKEYQTIASFPHREGGYYFVRLPMGIGRYGQIDPTTVAKKIRSDVSMQGIHNFGFKTPDQYNNRMDEVAMYIIDPDTNDIVFRSRCIVEGGTGHIMRPENV